MVNQTGLHPILVRVLKKASLSGTGVKKSIFIFVITSARLMPGFLRGLKIFNAEMQKTFLFMFKKRGKKKILDISINDGTGRQWSVAEACRASLREPSFSLPLFPFCTGLLSL